MQPAALEHWLNKRKEGILESADVIYPQLFPEIIHHFRTETKKLRAVLRLLQAGEDEATGLPQSFRKLYRAAGEIRDLQMQLGAVCSARRHALPEFAIWIAAELALAARRWHRRNYEEPIKALSGKAYDPPKDLPDTDLLQRFFRESVGRMKLLMAAPPADGDLHEVRKLVKDMQYVTEFCAKEWTEGYVLLQRYEKGLQRLSDRAGNFNDRFNLLGSLQRFREKFADQPDFHESVVEKAFQDWSAAALRERSQLIRAIRSFIRTVKI